MFSPLARNRSAELMDDPGLPQAEHSKALAGLARINRLSAAAAPIWREIRSLAARTQLRTRPLSLIDVASGSSDLLRDLDRRARRARIELGMTATDISQTALDIAAALSRGTSIAFLQHDILERQLPKSADIVTNSLFIHHLDPPQVVLALRRMMDATDRLLIVHDLRRTRRGLMLARLIPRLLTTSRVVHVDAVRSVQGAYTCAELIDMANAAGLKGARIHPTFPQRMLLTWERPA